MLAGRPYWSLAWEQRIAVNQAWELYLFVLSAILSPFASRIQRWWRARTPRPAASMVLLCWWYHNEDEPLYRRWFQVDLNKWGYSFQLWGYSFQVARTSLPGRHREQARVPPTA